MQFIILKPFTINVLYTIFDIMNLIDFCLSLPLEKREELYSAGLAIDQFLKHAEEEYGESVKYLLIIEGQASNDGFTGNFDLSYQRALSLYRYFQINRHLDLKRQKL